MITMIPRVLGYLFYYSPTKDGYSEALNLLPSLPQALDEDNQGAASAVVSQINVNENRDELEQRYNQLFVGLGELTAPPWGSVYLDSEGIVMGESTVDFRQFLAINGIELTTDMNEPEDQFGLMLMTFAQLMELESYEAAAELLQVHLLPWAPRYLELLIAENDSFYSQLAQLADIYLNELKEAFELVPVARPLFR
ncbi:oxidoreductase component of anaerobic dehydrogenases [Vibrio sp. JCM 19236]|nr:oxidoreductase component of anaerobic dehydrogenases [Vibrio sp. JCM 19236]